MSAQALLDGSFAGSSTANITCTTCGSTSAAEKVDEPGDNSATEPSLSEIDQFEEDKELLLNLSRFLWFTIPFIYAVLRVPLSHLGEFIGDGLFKHVLLVVSVLTALMGVVWPVLLISVITQTLRVYLKQKRIEGDVEHGDGEDISVTYDQLDIEKNLPVEMPDDEDKSTPQPHRECKDLSEEEKKGVINVWVILASSLTLYISIPSFNAVVSEKSLEYFQMSAFFRLWLLLYLVSFAAFTALGSTVIRLAGNRFCEYMKYDTRLGWNLEPRRMQPGGGEPEDEVLDCEKV